MIIKLQLIKIRFSLIFGFFLTLSVSNLMAQNLSVGLANMEDYFRRSQLLGQLDSTVSFNVRPISLQLLRVDDDNEISILNNPQDSVQTQWKLLPIYWQQKFNTHHPYSWNDGIMIPAKGYQTSLSGGFFFKSGIFSIQLRPELLFAENSYFSEYPSNYNGNDMPQRFGDKNYKNISWGQSRIGLNFRKFSIALSNENLWWGPGIQNALLISNTAPGFKHITFNTIKPIHTYIGSIEGQMIFGRLENSSYLFEVSDNWRYLTGFNLSYQPKWIPGLFLGITRSFQTYSNNLIKLSDYLPLFTAYQKVNDTNQNQSGSDNKDQITSLYLRWLLKKSHSEIYFEYGLNDNSYNIRDFFLSPQHSRAYLFGLRKLFKMNDKENEYFQIGLELTQMSQSIDRILRNAGSWYTHYQIYEGHTNKGQVLGAGVGPGGNIQTLNLGWYKGFKHLGLQFERYEHNADFYDATFANPINNGQWIDLSAAAISNWNYNRFLVNAKLQAIESINYQWNSGYNGLPKQNVLNMNLELGITYFFNQ